MTMTSDARRICAIAVVLSCPAAAVAEAPAGWSEPTVAHDGIRVMSADGETVQSRFHYQPPGRHREEMTREGMSLVVIMRQDLGLAWTLLPGGVYMEVSLDGDDSEMPFSAGSSAEGIVEYEKLGTEQVNGLATTRYRVVTLEDNVEAEGYFWVTEHWIPVKSEVWMRDDHGFRIEMEIHELNIGAQDPALFELPAGASRMPGFGGH
jgi:hypothetical protein